jgi:hypothetical protein
MPLRGGLLLLPRCVAIDPSEKSPSDDEVCPSDLRCMNEGRVPP